jgi:hypothetical protein
MNTFGPTVTMIDERLLARRPPGHEWTGLSPAAP